MKIEKPNYTQIPNSILDSANEFRPSEFIVLMVICRKTFGWHKEKDVLSLTQLEALTGLSRHTVIDAINGLRERGIIFSRATKFGTEYSVLVAGDSAETAPEAVQEMHQSSAETAPELVQKVHTQKKDKNTIRKKEKESEKISLDEIKTMFVECMARDAIRGTPFAPRSLLTLDDIAEKFSVYWESKGSEKKPNWRARVLNWYLGGKNFGDFVPVQPELDPNRERF